MHLLMYKRLASLYIYSSYGLPQLTSVLKNIECILRDCSLGVQNQPQSG